MVPHEFTHAGVEAASVDAFRPCTAFLRSGEPYASIFVNNPWLLPPKAEAELEWGRGWYYDTTVASKHEHWRDVELPTPTKDLQRLRHDLHDWGFCLIEDGLSDEQCDRIRLRVADQTWIAPIHTHEAPVLVNAMYVLQDVDQRNGGTLLVPGSHRANGTPETGLYGPLPRPINLEAPAGTVLIFDGRLLHGGAVNHSDDFRYVLTNSCVKPWVRQQESFVLGMSPEVLETASAKLLWRTGLQSSITANLVEGFGYRGTGRRGDPNGSLAAVRREIDDGGYVHVGELSMATLGSVDVESLSLTRLQRSHEDVRQAEHLESMARLNDLLRHDKSLPTVGS